MLKKLATFIDFSQIAPNHEKKNEFTSKNSSSFDFLKLIHAWQEIAGNKLSEHTIPLKNQNNTLIVLSNHSAFASEMKFMEGPLKKKIFQKFPKLESHIKSINFIVDSTYFDQQYNLLAPQIKNKKIEILMPHPFSPESKKLQQEAKNLFEQIEDEELKKSLISLYVQSKFNSAK